jgi:hypothetical protein
MHDTLPRVDRVEQSLRESPLAAHVPANERVIVLAQLRAV